MRRDGHHPQRAQASLPQSIPVPHLGQWYLFSAGSARVIRGSGQQNESRLVSSISFHVEFFQVEVPPLKTAITTSATQQAAISNTIILCRGWLIASIHRGIG
jgi:hypothetical protein